jgi:hypothetical protein
MPEAAPLALLRTNIDRSPHRIKRVLTDPGIRKEMLGGVPNDEKKAIKAFVSQNGENALKTKPKVSTAFYFRLTSFLQRSLFPSALRAQVESNAIFATFSWRGEEGENASICALTTVMFCDRELPPEDLAEDILSQRVISRGNGPNDSSFSFVVSQIFSAEESQCRQLVGLVLVNFCTQVASLDVHERKLEAQLSPRQGIREAFQ